MSIFLLFAFAAVAFSQLDLFGDDDETDTPDAPSPDEPETRVATGGTEDDPEVIETGDGNDTITMEGHDVQFLDLNTGAGDDEIQVSAFDSTVASGDGDDVLTFEGGRGTFDTGAGDDTVEIERDFEGELLLGDGNDTLETSLIRALVDAGSGDDTLEIDDLDESTVSGGAGADNIFVSDISYGSEVFGDEGDDTIEAYSNDDDEVSLHGGQGDDLLRGEIGTSLFGDEGDDTLFFEMPRGPFDGAYPTVSGGEGDDTIHVDIFPNIYTSDYSLVSVYGDEGADTFVINVDMAHADLDHSGYLSGSEPPIVLADGLSLRDFDPNEDTLEIDFRTDPNDPSSVDQRVPDTFELVVEERVAFTTGETYYTQDLILHYAADGDIPASEVHLLLDSTQDPDVLVHPTITVDDIVFLVDDTDVPPTLV